MYTIWALVISIWIGIPSPHIEIETMQVFKSQRACLTELHNAAKEGAENPIQPSATGFWVTEYAWAECIPVPHNLVGA